MDNVYSFISLAKKANALSFGEKTCEMKIKLNNARLIILANDAGECTKKKFLKLGQRMKIKVKDFGNKEILGGCIGKGLVSVITINHSSFAEKLNDLI